MARRPSEDEGLRWSGRGGNWGSHRIGEWLVAIFCFGIVAFNPLVIRMFDRGIRVDVLGLPLLCFYLFSAWALLIILIAVVMESRNIGRGRRQADAARQRTGREAREP